MIIEEEDGGGGELAEKKGWCRTPVGWGRNRYRTGSGPIRRAATRGGRGTSTQASCTDYVVRKIDGTLTTGSQGSARRLTYLRHNRRGLAAFASRVLVGRTGTPCNQTGRNTIRRKVNLNSGGNRAGKEYITHLWDHSTTVYKHISRMKVALLVLIWTYVWNQGQENPMVGDNKPLPSKYSAQLFDCGVPGKIQTLQIPETCEDRSAELERETLRETYVLSPRKLKKTSGVM